ncbi:TonB-dependent receptor domain-containing protein [Roseicyclus mahoneyensis]|uniref:Hemoglobin/transferrin/lactoferrin receptor protein n=1 Tax=Roseicyclus mahoneyensis TaxID=164332 RepID=A0A316GBZ7_9RHOB|nr:TonB-dependent receptor [Roseicyclus mahoneyensis]PWK58162.1 hemoglobin/transferrin/lactoferrin receptor protein [Roseicyclus mahoneyensis]
MRRITHLLTTALVAVAGHGAQAQELGFTLDPILLGSAFRDDRALLDAPVSATVVDSSALADRQAADFEALIGDIPGLTIDGGPRGMAQEPNIRGFRDQQIVLRFDGGRFNYSQGHRGRFFVDPALIGRVEVVRGGGSTLFGSGALGGVISVETVDVADLIQPGQTMGGRVNLGYSSNGDRATANTTLFADYGAFDALLFLGTRQMGADVETGGGAPVPFSQLDSFNGMLKLGFEPSQDSRIELSFSRFLDDGLVPSNANGLAGTGNPVVDRAAQVDSFRLTWDYAPAGSDLIDLSVLFYAERLGITESRVDTPRLDDTTYDTTGLEITNRSSLSLGVPVDLVYGIEILRDTQQGLRNGAPRPAFPDAEATTIAGFVEGTFALGPQFDLIAGLRYDRYARDPDDPALASVTNEFLSPRLGLSYRPTEDWQVYANLSRAFRAPSLTELYNSGLHFPGNPFGFPPNNFFVPSPDLRPEASTQIEIGTRLDRAGQWRDGDRLSFAASAYYADVTDYIDQTVSIAGGTTTFVNVDARLWGFEAEVDYDAIDWFVGAGLGIARGQGSDGFALGSLPQDRLTLTAGFRPTQDWELGARATLAAEQDRLPAGGTPGPSYELLDLFATFAPDRGALAGSTIRIGLDNVFDESYTIYPNGLPQTGRSLQITASFTF